jgi:SLAP domain-containing protein
MIEGPIFEDGYTIFYVKGRVQNTGDNTAMFAQITIYIRNSSSGLLAQETTYIDDTELAPNETSPWDTIFSDSDGTMRSKMDFSKTTYEIKWDEKED